MQLDPKDPIVVGLQNGIDDVYKVLSNIPGGIESVFADTEAIKAALADLKAHPSSTSDPVLVAVVQKIEAALVKAGGDLGGA
jgi:hypothetical protein